MKQKNKEASVQKVKKAIRRGQQSAVEQHVKNNSVTALQTAVSHFLNKKSLVKPSVIELVGDVAKNIDKNIIQFQHIEYAIENTQFVAIRHVLEQYENDKPPIFASPANDRTAPLLDIIITGVDDTRPHRVHGQYAMACTILNRYGSNTAKRDELINAVLKGYSKIGKDDLLQKTIDTLKAAGVSDGAIAAEFL